MPIDHDRTERDLRRALADALATSQTGKDGIHVGNLNMQGGAGMGWGPALVAVAAAVVSVVAALLAMAHGT